jgi:hypothetical protein
MVQLLRHGRACQEAGAISSDTAARVATMAAPERRRLSSFLWQLYSELAGSVGDSASALDGISRALSTGLFDIRWMRRCPSLECARADPAFAPLEAAVEANAAPIRAVLDGV